MKEKPSDQEILPPARFLPDRDSGSVLSVVRLRTVGGTCHPRHFLQFASFTLHTHNNVESRLIHLGGRPRARTVIVTPWHGIEVIVQEGALQAAGAVPGVLVPPGDGGDLHHVARVRRVDELVPPM